MPNYFEVKDVFEPRIVGVKDGFGQVTYDDAFLKAHQWFDELYKPGTPKDTWRAWANIPDHAQPLHGLSLRPHAKLTDILGISLLHGYLINDKVRELLATANLPRHQYCEATLTRNCTPVKERYWWFVYALEAGETTVDFPQSTFTDCYGTEPQPVASYAEYLDIYYQTNALKARKLVFNENFDHTLDMWTPMFLSMKHGYISQKLHEIFTRNDVSGYRIRKSECDFVFA
ncbi:hypothetical protein [Hymenobacter sp. B81]|uniref:hypothetical protein n=1 Tax=Hymenobacter sp. B81 TaxID=3344878 RepID=UPI0037DC7517